MEFVFRVNIGDETHEVCEADLNGVTEAYGLDRRIPGRFSRLFVLDMLLLERVFRVNPFQIMDEIRALEDSTHPTRTKPAKIFRHLPLKGLWHKHYFSGRFIAKNVSDHLRGNKLRRIVEEVFDPSKSPVVTEDMIRTLAHRVTVEPFEAKAKANRLTGEWIVFAKYNSENYYLTLTTHDTGDDVIRENIRNVCEREFTFLSSVLA